MKRALSVHFVAKLSPVTQVFVLIIRHTVVSRVTCVEFVEKGLIIEMYIFSMQNIVFFKDYVVLVH